MTDIEKITSFASSNQYMSTISTAIGSKPIYVRLFNITDGNTQEQTTIPLPESLLPSDVMKILNLVLNVSINNHVVANNILKVWYDDQYSNRHYLLINRQPV